MRPFRAIVLTLCLLALGGPPGASAAQPAQISPGVFADPNSPAGKEYALQLQSARNTGSSTPNTSSRSPTLFGSGIKSVTPPPAPTPARPVRPRARRPVRLAPHSAVGRKPALPGARSAVPATAGSASTATESGAGTLALAGGAVMILAAGLVGGILLRRSRPGETTTGPTS